MVAFKKLHGGITSFALILLTCASTTFKYHRILHAVVVSPESTNFVGVDSDLPPSRDSDDEDADINNIKTSKRVLVAQYMAPSNKGISRSDNRTNNEGEDEDEYSLLLRFTQPLNELYAERWGFDYFVLRDWPDGLKAALLTDDQRRNRNHTQPSDAHASHNTTSRDSGRTDNNITNAHHQYHLPASRATYLKMVLLQRTIHQNMYDYLILLDADAVVYDFDYNLLNLLRMPSSRQEDEAEKTHGASWKRETGALVAAHGVDQGSDDGNDNDAHSYVHNSTNINVGVTIWDLRHPLAVSIGNAWQAECLLRIARGRSDDDQTPLHIVLNRAVEEQQLRDKHEQLVVGGVGTATTRLPIVHSTHDELRYGKGTVVKHFIRSVIFRAKNSGNIATANDHWASHDLDLQRRVGRLQQVWKDVCDNRQYALTCPQVPTYDRPISYRGK